MPTTNDPTTTTTTTTTATASNTAGIDMQLAAKGRAQPLAGLLEQAKVSSGLAKMYETALAPYGWSKPRTDALDAEIASLETDLAQKIETALASHHATAQEHAAIDASKQFIRRLRVAAPMAIRDTKVDGIPHNAFSSGGPITRSTPRIVAYLTSVRPIVVKLDGDLAPYFPGEKASAQLDRVKSGLDTADVTQETKLSALPHQTLQVCETMGKVVEAFEDLNRIAKLAFDGDAGTRSAFNKDILLRARKSAKQATTSPSDASPSAEKSATTSPTPATPSDTKTATTSPTPSTPSDTKTATTSPTGSSGTSKTATLDPQSARI